MTIRDILDNVTCDVEIREDQDYDSEPIHRISAIDYRKWCFNLRTLPFLDRIIDFKIDSMTARHKTEQMNTPFGVSDYSTAVIIICVNLSQTKED